MIDNRFDQRSQPKTTDQRQKPCGSLALSFSPDGAHYLLSKGGEQVREGRLPLDRPLVLPEGTYQLSVQRSACGEYNNDTVRVQSGGAETIRATLLCPH